MGFLFRIEIEILYGNLRLFSVGNVEIIFMISNIGNPILISTIVFSRIKNKIKSKNETFKH